MRGQTAGKMRLGVIPTIAPYLLHKFIPTFVKAYPRVELEIHELKDKLVMGMYFSTKLQKDKLLHNFLY